MTRDQQLPVFDAGSRLKTARLAVAACVVLSAVTVAVLLIVDPPRQYPNWHLKDLNDESLWALMAALTAPSLGYCCLVVFCWNWFARAAAKRETPDVVPSSVGPITLPVTWVAIRVCVSMSFVFSTSAIFSCRRLHRLAAAVGGRQVGTAMTSDLVDEGCLMTEARRPVRGFRRNEDVSSARISQICSASLSDRVGRRPPIALGPLQRLSQ